MLCKTWDDGNLTYKSHPTCDARRDVMGSLKSLGIIVCV